MALHWAWDFSLQATLQQYADSGWGIFNADPAFTGAPLPRRPGIGYGGMAVGAELGATDAITTCAFPAGGLSDGIIQFHLYATTLNISDRIRLVSATGVILLELRVVSAVSPTTYTVWSGEGTMVSRGTTTLTFSTNAWHVFAIRLKIGANGYITIGIDGATETIVNNAATDIVSDWARLSISANTGLKYLAGITVYNDATDNALTMTKWVASLNVYSDHLTAGWSHTGGGSFYQDVDEVPLSTAEYCYIAAAGTILFGVDTATDISPSWNPKAIDGVIPVAAMQGATGLVACALTVHTGASTVTSATQVIDGEASQNSALFLTQADGTAWSVAGIDANFYGITVS